jgi:hypothetical protein
VLIDDFEGGPKLTWAPKTASRWGVDADNGDDSYHLKTTDQTFDFTRPGEYSLLNEGEFTEYEMEVDARSPETSNGTADLGIIFGFEDTDNFYYVTFVKWQNNVSIYKVSGGSRSTLQSVDNALTFDTNYHKLKLVVKDNTVKLYIDGAEKCSVSENVPQGKVGLCTLDDEAYFDDFKLTNLDGSTVGAGYWQNIISPVGMVQLLANPVSGQNIVFRFMQQGVVSLRLFDVGGRETVQLADRLIVTNGDQLDWDTSGTTGGLYYYRLEMGDYIIAGKVMVIK